MKAMFGEIVYRLNADIGDYVKELRVIGRLVSDTDPMDAEPIPSFDELKGQLGYSVDGFYMESGFRDAEGFYYSFRDWDDCFVRIPDDYEMSIRVIIQYQNMKKDILGERASPVLSMKRHETLVLMCCLWNDCLIKKMTDMKFKDGSLTKVLVGYYAEYTVEFGKALS